MLYYLYFKKLLNMSKKDISSEDFLTRSEKIKLYDLPVTDEFHVTVNPNSEALGFRFNCYKPEILEDKVDKKTFDDTVLKAHKICENVWSRRKMEEEVS